jgi:hypothetical protein
MTQRVEGWPADRGPLKTLHDLRLIADPTVRPNWMSQWRTYPNPSAPDCPSYQGSARFLRKDGLRHLAALTLEGWDVYIAPAMSNQLDFKITGKP